MTVSTPRGYRSDVEYPILEDEADAIVRVVAYHRKDFCQAVIWFSPREHADIRLSMAASFGRACDTGLGSLNRLPLELLHDILLRLDLQSLFRFRQTNGRSREMVYSLHQFRMVVSHGTNLFCALLRTRVASSISLFDFYQALCTKVCTKCDEFGGFISLLTWARCCFKCLQLNSEFRVQTLASARKQFQLTKAEVARLKTFKTLPSIYSMEESLYKSRLTVVSAHQIMSVVRPPTVALAQATPTKQGSNQKLTFMGSCALPYYDTQSSKVENGVSCAGCQLALEKDIIGTRGEKWAFEARDKVYAKDGFLEYFRWCEQAQLLWRSSSAGNNLPADLPEAAQRGGYFNERQ